MAHFSMHWILYLNILFSLLELSHPSSPEYVFGIQSIHFSPGLPRWLESERHSVVSDSLQPHGLYGPWNSPGWNTGVGILSLLQGIFPIPWTVANPLLCPWGFFGQEYWSGSPFPSPGIQPASPAWYANSLPLSHRGSPDLVIRKSLITP